MTTLRATTPRAPRTTPVTLSSQVRPLVDRAYREFARRAPDLAHDCPRDTIAVVDDGLEKAAVTDAGEIMLAARFVEQLNESELAAEIAAHTLMARAHGTTRRGDRDPAIWDLAMTHEVQSALATYGLRRAEATVCFAELVGQRAETTYPSIASRVHRAALAVRPARTPSRSKR